MSQYEQVKCSEVSAVQRLNLGENESGFKFSTNFHIYFAVSIGNKIHAVQLILPFGHINILSQKKFLQNTKRIINSSKLYVECHQDLGSIRYLQIYKVDYH